jgi:hypothetical protein
MPSNDAASFGVRIEGFGTFGTLRVIRTGGVKAGDGVTTNSNSSRGRLGRRWIADVPGWGNWHSSARPEDVQRSHGGASFDWQC